MQEINSARASVHPHYATKAVLTIAVTLIDLAVNVIADHTDYASNGLWYLAVLFRCVATLIMGRKLAHFVFPSFPGA